MKVFISYRRDDAAPWAGRIYDSLANELSSSIVFIDIDSILAGDDFEEKLNIVLSTCEIMLVLISKSWVNAKNESGDLKLFLKNDYVKHEIKSAIKNDMLLLAVLLDGAKMPDATQLPPEITALATRNAVKISHDRYKADIDNLLSVILSNLKKSLIHLYLVTPLVYVIPILAAAVCVDIFPESRESALIISGISFCSVVSIMVLLKKYYFRITLLVRLFWIFAIVLWASVSSWFFLVGTSQTSWAVLIVPFTVVIVLSTLFLSRFRPRY